MVAPPRASGMPENTLVNGGREWRRRGPGHENGFPAWAFQAAEPNARALILGREQEKQGQRGRQGRQQDSLGRRKGQQPALTHTPPPLPVRRLRELPSPQLLHPPRQPWPRARGRGSCTVPRAPCDVSPHPPPPCPTRTSPLGCQTTPWSGPCLGASQWAAEVQSAVSRPGLVVELGSTKRHLRPRVGPERPQQKPPSQPQRPQHWD